MRQANPHIVSASDVASWAFCPESWRLTECGWGPANAPALEMGEAHHAEGRHLERSTSTRIRLGMVLLLAAGILVVASILGGALQ